MAGAVRSFYGFVRVEVLVLGRSDNVSFFPGVVVRFSLNASSSFGETRSFRVHLSRVNGGAAVKLDCVGRHLSFAQVVNSRFGSDRLVFQLRTRRNRKRTGVIVRVSLYVRRVRFLFRCNYGRFLHDNFPINANCSRRTDPWLAAVVVDRLLRHLGTVFRRRGAQVLQ